MLGNIIQNIRNRLTKSFKNDKTKTKPLDQILADISENVVLTENIPVPAPGEGRKVPKRRPPAKKKKEKTWDISQFDIPEVPGKKRFHDLGLPLKIVHAIADLGFQYCTPIQAEILPRALNGADVTGKAQTGTGKSAAFLLNIYNHLMTKPIRGGRRPGVPRALILAPTRELVMQIENDARLIGKYANISILSIFGGLGYASQKQTLTQRPVDIMVATPGRLLDFQQQNLIKLYKLEILVIDEADRMLDMGFIPDVRKIVYSSPPKHKRQTMFFSATITPEVEHLAEQWTCDPVHVEIEPEHVAAESVNQIVYIVTTEEKFALLYNIIVTKNLERVLVFVNRRDQTIELADRLKQYGINCAVISGAIAQNMRIKTLADFRNGRIRVLVATDVAARGLHIKDISHVMNFNLPHDPEDYVHRIGRTGRAGASGISISFACEEDSYYIPPIEEFIGNPLPCIQPDEAMLVLPALETTKAYRDKLGQKSEKTRSMKRPRKRQYRRPRKERSGSGRDEGSLP